MDGQTFSVDSLVGELVEDQELNISDSDDDRQTTVRGKNTHQLDNKDVVSLSRPLFQTLVYFGLGNCPEWVKLQNM